MKISGEIQSTIDYDRELIVIHNTNERVAITISFNDFPSFVEDIIQIEKELDDVP